MFCVEQPLLSSQQGLWTLQHEKGALATKLPDFSGHFCRTSTACFLQNLSLRVGSLLRSWTAAEVVLKQEGNEWKHRKGKRGEKVCTFVPILSSVC